MWAWAETAASTALGAVGFVLVRVRRLAAPVVTWAETLAVVSQCGQSIQTSRAWAFIETILSSAAPNTA